MFSTFVLNVAQHGISSVVVGMECLAPNAQIAVVKGTSTKKRTGKFLFDNLSMPFLKRSLDFLVVRNARVPEP